MKDPIFEMNLEKPILNLNSIDKDNEPLNALMITPTNQIKLNSSQKSSNSKIIIHESKITQSSYKNKIDAMSYEHPISKMRKISNESLLVRIPSDRRSLRTNASDIFIPKILHRHLKNRTNKEYISVCVVEDKLSSTPAKDRPCRALIYIGSEHSIDGVEESQFTDDLMDIEENLAKFKEPLRKMIGFTQNRISYLVTGHDSGLVRLWKITPLFEKPEEINQVQLDYDIENLLILFDKYLLVVHTNAEITIIDINEEKLTQFADIKFENIDPNEDPHTLYIINCIEIFKPDIESFQEKNTLRIIINKFNSHMKNNLTLYEMKFSIEEAFPVLKNVKKIISKDIIQTDTNHIQTLTSSIHSPFYIYYTYKNTISWHNINNLEYVSSEYLCDNSLNTTLIKEIIPFDCASHAKFLIFQSENNLAYWMNLESLINRENNNQDIRFLESSAEKLENINVLWDNRGPKVQLSKDSTNKNHVEILILVNNKELIWYQMKLV